MKFSVYITAQVLSLELLSNLSVTQYQAQALLRKFKRDCYKQKLIARQLSSMWIIPDHIWGTSTESILQKSNLNGDKELKFELGVLFHIKNMW